MWVALRENKSFSGDIGKNNHRNVTRKMTGEEMSQNISRVRRVQKERSLEYNTGLKPNKEINRGKKELRMLLVKFIHGTLSVEAKEVLETAIKNTGMSMRAADSTLLVARTIADLESSKLLEKSPVLTSHHILEALSYRKKF